MFKNSSKIIITQSNQSSVRTANHRLLYFFRYGNKENIEVCLRKFIRKRAIKIHKSLNNTTSSSIISKGTILGVTPQLKANRLFNSFSHTVIPFVMLKIKKSRKKQENSKIFPLTS